MNGAARPVASRAGPPTANRCGPALLTSSPAAAGPSSGSVGPIAAPRQGDRERSRSAMGPDSAPPQTPPPEQRFAARLAARQMSAPTSARTAAVTALNELGQVDLAVYRAIAGTPAPTLDRPIRRLSAAANWSRLWLRHRRRDGRCGRSRRPAGGRCGAHGDRGRLRRRQHRPQGRRPTRAARPRLGRCTRCPEGADAGVSVVPLRAHRIRLRLHERRRAYLARGRRTAGPAR